MESQNINEISNNILRHSFSKHAHEFDNYLYGSDENTRTREAVFRQHVEMTLNNKETKAYVAEDGRKIYYNDKSNTFISQNDLKPDRSTCFRPDEGAAYFEKELKKDAGRKGIAYAEASKLVKTGGYPSLHPNAIPSQNGGKSTSPSSGIKSSSKPSKSQGNNAPSAISPQSPTQKSKIAKASHSTAGQKPTAQKSKIASASQSSPTRQSTTQKSKIANASPSTAGKKPPVPKSKIASASQSSPTHQSSSQKSKIANASGTSVARQQTPTQNSKIASSSRSSGGTSSSAPSNSSKSTSNSGSSTNTSGNSGKKGNSR